MLSPQNRVRLCFLATLFLGFAAVFGGLPLARYAVCSSQSQNSTSPPNQNHPTNAQKNKPDSGANSASQRQEKHPANQNKTPNTIENNYGPDALLCGESKLTDLALVFFTFCLAVVGWFSLRSNEQTTIDLERAYVLLSHGQPILDGHGHVILPLETVNVGRMTGILKEMRYKFVHKLPAKPEEATWKWEGGEMDWSLPRDIRRDMGAVSSPYPGHIFFAGFIRYQDIFSKKWHTSWTAIEFTPGGGKANNKRGGGDPWNAWD